MVLSFMVSLSIKKNKFGTKNNMPTDFFMTEKGEKIVSFVHGRLLNGRYLTDLSFTRSAFSLDFYPDPLGL